jgi:AcrR family transcriptional regulator
MADQLDRILDGALEEFASRGVAGARWSVIARKAGVSVATLRRSFPSKEELFREVVRSCIVGTLHAAEPEAGPGPDADDAVQRVREFAHRFWRTMERPGHSALLRLSVSELHRFPELAAFHAVEVVGRAAQRLERIIRDGVARGELDVPDPRAAARVILAALITHAQWFSLPEVYSVVTGADRARAEDAVVEVLAGALRGP